MIWATISLYCAGPALALNGRITASDYMDILGDQVRATVRMLLDIDVIFQDDSLPITQTEVFSLRLRRMNMHSSSFLASSIARIKYHQITVVSFREC
jgi:hypothetical protein